jgi:hypothetical protein
MKKVFEYMGWCDHNFSPDEICKKCNRSSTDIILQEELLHHLDGNDMVEAINKMVEKGDWIKFYLYVENVYFKKSHIGFNTIEEAHATFFHWLFSNPDNFFKLMEEWLNEKADQL